jgi:hypothetical protein
MSGLSERLDADLIGHPNPHEFPHPVFGDPDVVEIRNS